MTIIVGKYTVLPDCYLAMPAGAKLLSVREQWGEIRLWALIDTARPEVERHFKIFETGHPIESAESLHFVGTALLRQGRLVFHVFEEAEL